MSFSLSRLGQHSITTTRTTTTAMTTASTETADLPGNNIPQHQKVHRHSIISPDLRTACTHHTNILQYTSYKRHSKPANRSPKTPSYSKTNHQQHQVRLNGFFLLFYSFFGLVWPLTPPFPPSPSRIGRSRHTYTHIPMKVFMHTFFKSS